jgi:molecular chaperone GrpE
VTEETATEEVVDGEVAAESLQIDLPEDPTEAVGVLTEALQASEETASARLDDLQRLAAEFDNYRKRAMRDQQETVERASQRLVEALLPVLDSFDGAFAHEAQSPGEELLQKGITSTYHQLFEILQREGLEPIAAEGEAFDPALHEAVSGGAGDDLVVSNEMRRGYTLHGRVIRPAMVAVAPAGDEGEAGEA